MSSIMNLDEGFVSNSETFKYITIYDNIIIFGDMMLTPCEQKIMELMLPCPYQQYSIREVSKRIRVSYALTYGSIHSLMQKNLIHVQKIGKSLICMLNLSADATLLALSSLAYSYRFLKEFRYGYLIQEIKEKLVNQSYTLLLFGSYAKGTATKKSDIDLLFIVGDNDDIENTRKRIMLVISSTQVKIEFEIITIEWLIQMFNEKNSVGREALHASIVLHGAEQYYTWVGAYDKKRGH